jgi:hypothetical protein
MSGILLPEVVIYDLLTKIVKFLREDLSSNADTDTFLYKILGVDEAGEPIKMNLYNYFTQAKKMIENPQNLSVNFGYNIKVAKLASLHILLPNERATSPIGEDEGYIEEDVYEDGEKIGVQQYLSQMFESTYQIMITSMNNVEVNVIYNILKSMLLVLVPQIELMGLRVPTFSGNDIVMQDDLAEVPIFHKVLNITFKYEHIVPKFAVEKIAKNIKIVLRPIENK